MKTKFIIGIAALVGFAVVGVLIYPKVFPSKPERKILYWTDPMLPGDRSDHPGKSPMGMERTPVYADAAQAEQQQQKDEYYCPMHPNTTYDKPGVCNVCGMSLVKKVSSQGESNSNTAELRGVSLSPTQRVMANISIAKVERRSVNKDIQAVGVVSYAEPNYRHISMRFPGRLDKLYLSYTGQTVRKGDPVADVYSPEAISAQQEYLLSLDSYEQARLSSESVGGQATQGEQTFATSAAQMLEQSKQKLLQWGFTEQQFARLKETRKVNYLVTIYSPVSGTVVKKSVDPQHYTATGEDMFDVADLSTVWILLDVYEKDIRFVSRGQSAQITTEAYPNEKFKGRVVFVDPVLNPETRTIRVRTEFSNPQRKLKPNMFVNATIAIPKANALVVPSSAVLSTGRRAVIWVEVKENTFEPRDVVVGSTSEGFTVVLAGGLDEGETVAETGGFLIDSESALTQPTAVDPHAGHRAASEGKK